MKTLFSLLLFISSPAIAQDSKEFCGFLLSRASVDSSKQIPGQDTKSKLNALMDIHKTASNFLDLAKTGVDKKMSWNSFKKFAAEKKGASFSDYYQPQYDKLYLDRYCGKVKTESSVQIVDGVTKRMSEKTTFELNPNPEEHEYSKEAPATK